MLFPMSLLISQNLKETSSYVIICLLILILIIYEISNDTVRLKRNKKIILPVIYILFLVIVYSIIAKLLKV